jgi:ABC-type uncharacterized transport system permease subunit
MKKTRAHTHTALCIVRCVLTIQVSNDFVGHCSDGCLFELRADPLEANDLAAKFPERVKTMRTKLMAYVSLHSLYPLYRLSVFSSIPFSSIIFFSPLCSLLILFIFLNSKTLFADSLVAFVQQSLSSLSRYEDTAFNPHRGVDDPQACEMAMGEYGGFWGPFVFP